GLAHRKDTADAEKTKLFWVTSLVSSAHSACSSVRFLLFVPQGLDGVEVGRPTGRVPAEEDADGYRDAQRPEDRGDVQLGRQPGAVHVHPGAYRRDRGVQP